ncbi:TPA: hypothetical protein ACXI82_004318 [Escherichia coli]
MTEQEMPRYQCHKKVRALKIGSIEHKPNPDQSGKTGSSSYGAIIHPDDKKYAAFDVSAEYICKHRPMSGVKWFTEFGHLNRGDMLTSEQHRCHNEKKKFQRRV